MKKSNFNELALVTSAPGNYYGSNNVKLSAMKKLHKRKDSILLAAIIVIGAALIFIIINS